MKIVKAKKKLEVPRELALSKTYSRIRRPQPASITTLNVQNERWNSFNQKAAELASCHKANIIILAHFPDCENEPTGMSYVSAFGDVAKEYQGKIVLQNLVNKFAQKCSQPDQSTESSQEEETNSPAKEGHHQSSLVTVVRNFSEVIDQVATDSTKEPTCLTNQIEDEEEIMEDIVVSMTENEAIKSFSSPRSTSSMIKDDENPRVLTLNNYSPLKTYSVSPKSGKTNSRVLQAVHLRPKPLGKPVFVSNGHTYASLEDGSVVKVVPIQFARQDAGHNKEVQVEEVASAIEVASSESSTPLPPGCVEIIMSTEINEAIEAMNNDVLAPPSEDTSVVVVEHLQQPLFNNDETTAERKRGRPRRGGAPYPSASSVPRSSRNDKSNYKFKCDFCTRSFRDSFDLKVHVRTHTGERPFRCDECDQSFSLKCTLKVHQLLHTGERPFQCELCDKAFTRNDYLTRHLTSHTGSKPFTCPKCKKGFALRGRLNKHQRDLKHFDDTPPVADWGPLTDL